MAVYSVDIFTAVNLLAFNTWSSEIKPAISFDITKWIFSISIILSIVNLGYEHIRANMIIRRGSVAESFLDNLAVRLQSIRFGSGKGWRRFLVFAELTKSKKGAEYIALFTYFSLQGKSRADRYYWLLNVVFLLTTDIAWIRIIFCSGPRQVVNAVTLYSVYNAKLQIEGDSFETSLESLFNKIKALAQQDYQQALILSGMLFTLVVWVLSALSFILACLFFVFFLWGWIPREDGGLSGYCERKVTKRLMKIVSAKVDAAIADKERQRKKAELKAAKKAGNVPQEERKATLPNLMPQNDDKLPDMPMLTRNDTVSTLPLYTSRPGTPQDGFEMNKMPPMPPMPPRSDTMTTASTRAPLLGAGAEMGMASPGIPSPGYGHVRTNTMSSTSSRPGPPPLSRVQTNNSNFDGSYSANNGWPAMPQTVRSPTSASVVSYGMPPRSTPTPRMPYDDYNRSESPAPLRQMPSQTQFSDYSSNGRASPAPSRQMTSRPTFDEYNRPQGPAYGQGAQGGPLGPRPGGYPNRSQTGPVPYRGPPGPPPQRNMTAPVPQMYQSPQPQYGFQGPPPPEEYMNRPGTAQSQRSMQGAPQPGQLQRQPTNQSYASSAYSDVESRRGTPGPRY